MDESKNNLHIEDDSDIKIAGGRTAKEDTSAADAASLELYDRLRRNGELSRARRLGAFLAGRIDEINASAALPAGSEKVELHRRLMIIFSAVAAMESCLPERMLVQTALNVFYDTLKKESPELYDAMSVSGAITFYYLEYRKLGQMPADIGGAFAMLCGREEDPEMIAMGSDLFVHAYEYVQSVIQNASFEG